MGNFAENLNLGNRFRPPLLLTSGNHSFSVVKWHVRRRHPYQHGREYPKHQNPTF